MPEAIDTTWYGIDKAIADYTEAIRLDPNLALAYNSRGIAYQKIGEEAKVAADFVKAKQLGFEPQVRTQRKSCVYPLSSSRRALAALLAADAGSHICLASHPCAGGTVGGH